MADKLQRLNLELTSRCSYACVGCPTHELIRGKGSMDAELYKAILDEVGNNLDRIFLWGYGEPLLHPQATELIRYAGNFSTKKVMSTTGWRLEDLSDVEALTHLDELIISINGLTPEVYAQHQINGDLEKVIRGMEKVASVLADSKTRFIMQIVAHKGNLDELKHAEDFAKRYGFRSEKVIRGMEKVASVLADSKTRFIMQIVAHKGNLDELKHAEDFAKRYGF